ncbi:MAG: hypothetical protein FD134_913 [Gallionellaceae bacterium]|nr:MAG: hypothetical protein FD134_913 [Gallionellaceae bacterium]
MLLEIKLATITGITGLVFAMGPIPVMAAAGTDFAAPADLYQEATAGREPVIGASYFGTHFHRLVLNPGERALLTHWPSSRIGAIRLWDSGTLWSEIATQPGQWKYERMDSYVEQAVVRDADILYTLGGTPRWASARRDEPCPYGLGCAAEPVRMAHWEEYVRRVVQRYRGRIKAYELWNEPHFSDIPRDRNAPGFYTGSVAQMVEMARIARKVLDENDPNAVLATPGFGNGPDRLELFLEAGGKQYIQAVAYHFYSRNSDEFAKQIVEVRNIMKRQGLENLPLWNTETGVGVDAEGGLPPAGNRALSYPEAAARFAQYLVVGGAASLEYFYHYAWDNERSGMMDRSGATLPGRFVYEKVQEWLLGARMLGCKKALPHAVICEGERDGARFAVAWSEAEQPYFLPAPPGWVIASLERMPGAGDIPQTSLVWAELNSWPLYIRYQPAP